MEEGPEATACACHSAGWQAAQRRKTATVKRKGLACFFAMGYAMCAGCKNHDRPAAMAGRKARKIMVSDGLHRTEVNEWVSECNGTQ